MMRLNCTLITGSRMHNRRRHGVPVACVTAACLGIASSFCLKQQPVRGQWTHGVHSINSLAMRPASTTDKRALPLHMSSLSVPPRQKRVNEMFKRPLRISLLVEPTPFTHVSGYANRFTEMLKHLHKAGDRVDIVTTDDVEGAPDKFLDYDIHYTPGFRFSLYKHICLTFDVKLVAYNLLKKVRPQLMHVATPGFFCLAAAIYARLLRIPLVFSYHTHLPIYARDYMGFVPGIEKITRFAIKLISNMADLLVVTSPEMEAELESFGVRRIAVWRKGIDTQKFNPIHKSQIMRERLSGGHPDAPLLLYVGRLGAEKKLKTLRGVLERIPNARLAIVGGGPADEDLREHFKGTRTLFTGVLHGKELSEAFASADVFLMPSDSETLGFVVLESMASGVPCVGAAAGGIPNLINHGVNGYLVPLTDEKAYADKVQLLLKSTELMQRMRDAARKEAERWDWESAIMDLRNRIYLQAIEYFNSRSFGGLLWCNSRGSLKRWMDGLLGSSSKPPAISEPLPV